MPEETTIEDELGGKAADDAGSKEANTGDAGNNDEVEILAKEMGWRPKENFNGDEADFVDAVQYIRKGQDIQDGMRKSLKDQKRQLSDMSVSLTELKQHNERVFKAEVGQLKKELNDLKQQKKAAIQDGDVTLVDELDEQIDTVKESMVPPEQTKTQQSQEGERPEFDAWVKENPWYDADPEMQQYADSLAGENKGLTFDRLAKLVSRKTEEAFPDKFLARGKTRDAVSRVEAGGRKVTTGNFTKADLSDSQKTIMNQFVRQGIMSEKDYIRDISITQGAKV